MPTSRLLACFCVSFVLVASPIEGFAEEPLRFNRDIRPILSENCYHCHGPDDAARAADLRLDVEEDAKDWAIVDGDPDASELITRVFSDDADTVMPPPDSERALSKEQKETLRRWVREGAAYEPHWSFLPPRKEQPSRSADQCDNPIDCFVLEKLRDAKIAAAEPADRGTLLRRMTFDLIGLPPTLDEIEAFVADDSPNAVERVIDRLLADPRFGERMAADWLDVARYSDTYGYQVDRDRFVWPWRDWVVDAFNRNLGYDQFLTEQLAGDLLPDASRDQILATTFNRLHPQKVEGGSVPEEFRIEYVADRTQTVGTAFLGLTMECCRCHSHKYDPITQTEYYELSAFFANVDEAGLYSYFTQSIPTPTLTLPTEAEAVALERAQTAIDSSLDAYQQALQATKPPSAFDRESYRKTVAVTAEKDAKDKSTDAPSLPETKIVDTLFAQPIESIDFEAGVGANQSVEGVVGKAVKLTGDDAVNLKQGNFRRDQPFSVSLWMNTPDEKERAVVFHRSRAWTDAASRGYQLLIEDGHLSWSLIHFWPGNAIRIRTADKIPVDQWIHVAVSYDGSSSASGLAIYVNGKRAETVVVRDNLTKNITGGGGDNIAIGQRFRDKGFTAGLVDEFRLFDVELTPLEASRLALPGEKLAWVETPLEQWSPQQSSAMAEHLRFRHDSDVLRARTALATARRQYCATQDRLKEIMVMREMGTKRVSYRLNRGLYDDRAETVQPATPRAVRKFGNDARRDRLGLAHWMTQPDHPLTSRVAINRLWQSFFGVGLVRTPEDFGSQGEPPTHPELLDWLAMDFVEHGWDVKRTIKLLMMSRTYQQSSEHSDPRVWEMDPENRLLARHNAYRLARRNAA